MRRRHWISLIVAVLLLSCAWIAYPIYPSTKSLCALADERVKCSDRWASPHRGAVVVLNGELYGTSEDIYGFRARCQDRDFFIAITTSPATLSTTGTRAALRALKNPNVLSTDRYGKFTIVARVRSETQMCFGPPMVLSAVAIQARSAVQVRTRPRRWTTLPPASPPSGPRAREQ